MECGVILDELAMGRTRPRTRVHDASRSWPSTVTARSAAPSAACLRRIREVERDVWEHYQAHYGPSLHRRGRRQRRPRMVCERVVAA